MQTQTQAEAVRYWDAADAEGRRREHLLHFKWEADELDAMFTAEVCGGRTLMERATGPLLFLLAAIIAAGVLVAGGRAAGWIQ